MNISQILVDGIPVDVLKREDLLNPKKLITFINGDVPQPTIWWPERKVVYESDKSVLTGIYSKQRVNRKKESKKNSVE